MKPCIECGCVKPLSEFYKHGAMRDGHLNKCKPCIKRQVSEYRAKNIEVVRKKDRARSKNKERIAHAAAVMKAWRAEDTRRAKCHSAVARAIKAGRLTRKPCEKCNSKRSVAHHDDYNKPLAVRWLCQPCHKDWHKLNPAQ